MRHRALGLTLALSACRPAPPGPEPATARVEPAPSGSSDESDEPSPLPMRRAWPVEACGDRDDDGAPALRIMSCGCGEPLSCSLITRESRLVLEVEVSSETGGQCRACMIRESATCKLEGTLPSSRAWIWVNDAFPIVMKTSESGAPIERCNPIPLPATFAAFETAPMVAVVEATAVEHECSGAGGTHVALSPREILRGPSFGAALIGGHAKYLDVRIGELFLVALEPLDPPAPAPVSPGWCVENLPDGDARVLASSPVVDLAFAKRLFPILVELGKAKD